MHITFSQHANVTLMRLQGDVDSSNYTEVIIQAQKAYDDGSRNLLIDLSAVAYVSSAGLMAFHTLARIFAGHAVQGGSSGRPVFRSLNPATDSAARDHIKLFSPQLAVRQVLEMVGLSPFFEIHTDLDTALDSFRK